MAGEDISYGQSISGVPGCSAVEGKMALLRYMDHELKCMAWLISQGPEMREIRRLGKRRSGVGSCGWAYESGHTVWGLWCFMLTLTRQHPRQKGHETALWTHAAYYFVHCAHVACPNWNMLLVKILDFKDLGVQKRNVKCFLLLLITCWNVFLISGWIKVFWNIFFFFTIFHAVTRKRKVVCGTHPCGSHYADVGRKTWPAQRQWASAIVYFSAAMIGPWTGQQWETGKLCWPLEHSLPFTKVDKATTAAQTAKCQQQRLNMVSPRYDAIFTEV